MLPAIRTGTYKNDVGTFVHLPKHITFKDTAVITDSKGREVTPMKAISSIFDNNHDNGWGCTVKDIIKRLEWETNKKTKILVKSTLAVLLKQERVEKRNGSPNLWRKSQIRRPIITHVFIDVDNSPCLKEAVEELENEDTKLWAYASPAYNHYVPGQTIDSVHFEKLSPANGLMSSAADAMFGMKMTELCMHAALFSRRLVFIVVSKDKILATMAKLHAQIYPEIVIKHTIVVDGWNGLKKVLNNKYGF